MYKQIFISYIKFTLFGGLLHVTYNKDIVK